MILPCRIRGCRNHVPTLRFALFFAACFLAPIGEAMAQGTEGSASEEAGVSWFPAVPLQITAGVDLGYDDHVLGSNPTTGGGGQGSFSTRENLVLTYDRPAGPTQVHLIGVGRFTQFLDTGTDDKSGNLTLAVTHNFSTRLSISADVYASYQTEPDFQSDVGPENVRAAHFDTHDIFSLSYHWLPRVSTITSFTFDRIQYEQTTATTTAIGIAQDRSQYGLEEQLQFSLTRRTNLIGQYRFQVVDYDTAPRNSVTHLVLAGFDHHFTENLTFNVTAGESFRNPQVGESSMSPNVATALHYVGSNHSVTWTTSYGFEESNLQNATSRTTIRTGLLLAYDLTSRIGATARILYHHDENEGGPTGTASVGSQDSFDMSLGFRYTINKHFSAHVDYQHTTQSSLGSSSGYSRNRYFAGFTYTY
jgi:Putative beta-barrel porin 2